MFVHLMRKYAAFHDVEVISYCIMSNHFHLLVEVPPKKKGASIPMSDEAFLERLKAFSSKLYYTDIQQKLVQFRNSGCDKAAEEVKAKHTCRMRDLSCFMQGLKRRFTQWFNRTHNRTGTLWEGRFKSVLVEDGYAARVISAYIDLNPIRAGMVRRPEDYRWCSYGEAMKPVGDKGRALARAGLCRVMQLHEEAEVRVPSETSGVLWEKEAGESTGMQGMSGAEWYRMMLFADGEEVFSSRPEIGVKKILVRKGFKRQDVEEVLAKGGKLSFGEALRCKVRYFSDGMVFGSRSFVDQVFSGSRGYFSEKRTTGARPLRGVGWTSGRNRLYSMRELKKEILK